ncbi:immunity protein Imm33 domain-containing protein [Anaerotruncus colihominis]|uniref:immunity protein Imm33 domain-containing protein n=1 Tax=Anaerotruncus colihominis TaxID=169435 RepID=UPI003512E328
MDQEMKKQFDLWHEADEYQKIVEAVLAIDEKERDYEAISQLARAYNNLGRYQKAAVQLLSVQEEGKNDYLWHYRLGYSYYYLDRARDAARCFRQSLALHPGDEDCADMLRRAMRLSDKQNKGRGRQTKYLKENSQTDDSAPGRREAVRFAPELYSREELDRLESFIARRFGRYESVFHELISPDIHVDIAIIAPNEERNYYTLVTMGMGAHRMNVPDELRRERLERAEMVICLPPDWKVQEKDEKWYWPMRWLKVMARLPGNENSWLGWGHTVPNGGPFAEGTPFSGILLATPGPDADGNEVACEMGDGSRICFYQMVPVYENEMEFKVANGADLLIERFGDAYSPVMDVTRPDCCAFMSRKKWAKSSDEMKELLTNWDGPDGCIATDRITVDGCPVGFMYREEPNGDVPDSGWRFTAGDEDDEYMDDPEKSGIFTLNTICNYDPDILPYLNAPYGTAYFRNDDGAFEIDEEWKPDDDDYESDEPSDDGL